MDETNPRVPGIEDVTWLLQEAEAARASGDMTMRLQRLSEASYSIALMHDAAILEMVRAPK